MTIILPLLESINTQTKSTNSEVEDNVVHSVPSYFTAVFEHASKSLNSDEKGEKIDTEWLNHFHLAVDTVTIADNPKDRY